MKQINKNIIFPALKAFGNVASGVGSTKKLQVMIYHRVLDKSDFMRPGEVSLKKFEWQMDLISRYFNIMPLSEAVNRLRSSQLPSRALSITFDDGYRDNLTNALPILKKYSVPATVFVSTGYLDGNTMWNDKIIESIRLHSENTIDLTTIGLSMYKVDTDKSRKNTTQEIILSLKHLPQSERENKADYIASLAKTSYARLMISRDELIELNNNGVEIGAHTVSHPILSKLEKDTALSEIANGKEMLEEILKQDITLFAYPNGRYLNDFNDGHVKMVRDCGYSAAFSTEMGVGSNKSDIFQLPRFRAWDTTEEKFLARMMLMYLKER